LQEPYNAGLIDGAKTEHIIWRGFKAPVPSHPFYYLEFIDQKWYQRRTAQAMIGKGLAADTSVFLSCAVKHGGLSGLERESLTKSEAEALRAKVEKACGPTPAGDETDR